MSPAHYKNSFLPYSLIFHLSSSLYTCYNVQMCTFVYRCVHIINYSLQMRDKMCFPFTAVRHRLYFLSLSIVLQMRNFIFLESRVGFHIYICIYIYIYSKFLLSIQPLLSNIHSRQVFGIINIFLKQNLEASVFMSKHAIAWSFGSYSCNFFFLAILNQFSQQLY